MTTRLGPERIVFADALQPFAIQTATGALFVQAQLRFPPGYLPPAKNSYPGIPGNIISRDGGKTWQRWLYTPPGAAAYTPTDSDNWNAALLRPEVGPIFEGAGLQLRGGPVIIMEWTGQGPENGYYENSLWESHDDLETVSGPMVSRIHLPEGKGGFDDGGHPYSGLTFHRTLLELPNGHLLACAYCWFKGDDTPCPYQPKMKKFRTVLLRSEDRARNWRYVSTIAVDPAVGEEGFDEPVMARVSRGKHAGRLVCLMRTGSNDCAIYQATSEDEGRTWSKPRPLEFRGVDPDLIELSDGRLACLIGRRVTAEVSEDRAYYLGLSEDAGETWAVAARWNVEPYAAVGWCTYYSTLRELAPGRLIAIYDIGFWTHPVRYTATREVEV